MNKKEWMLLPPGNAMICRHPVTASALPPGTRLATAAELLTANQGNPFPWGFSADSLNAAPIWKKSRVGVGGLVFDRWFVTSEGRFGGARNVPSEIRPASLRYCMLLDGGSSLVSGQLEENEGFALVAETTAEDRRMYRAVQMYAAERIGADRGGVAVSPIGDDGIVRVGFLGRYQICPNPEIVTVKSLQKDISAYHFELWPEWQNWSI